MHSTKISAKTSANASATSLLMQGAPRNDMPSALPFRSSRRVLAAVSPLLLCAYPLSAQQTAPAISLVARAATSPSSGPAVSFADGKITVHAENASLNQLIHEIARATGMKVTGSVTEDRVFGSYGPADPQVVLASLLDGSGSNLLILSNTADTPVQLVLTPRRGSVTPPNPNAAAQSQANNEDADDTAPQPVASTPVARRYSGSANPGAASLPQQADQIAAQSAPSTDPAATQPSSTSQQVVFPPIDPTSTPSTATTTPSNPDTQTDPGTNAVKTPQQIFDQLQRLRQQNTQTAPQ